MLKSAMHIKVNDILIESLGYSRGYKISGERPHFEAIQLTQDIEGEITISRSSSGLLVQGQLATEIELDCHRCLRTFAKALTVSFSQQFAKIPTDDDFPIEDDTIDVAPLIEQEIILSLPLKVLCSPDCSGIAYSAAPRIRK